MVWAVGTESSTSRGRSEEHTSELQSPCNLVCRLLLEKKKSNRNSSIRPDGSRDRIRPGLPWITMSCPGCCFSFETSAARSPSTTWQLFHARFVKDLDATNFGMLLNRSADRKSVV